MSEKKYKDSNGNDRTLYEMLNCEPEWIINRFSFMEKVLFEAPPSRQVETQVRRKIADDKEDLLKELWYKRNPCHDDNADTGKDMFWGTVVCVMNDLIEEINKSNFSA